MKSKLSQFTLLALCSLGCTAVVAAPPPADGQWRGTGGAALSVTSGNSSTQAFMLGADMARLKAMGGGKLPEPSEDEMKAIQDRLAGLGGGHLPGGLPGLPGFPPKK